MRAGVALWSAHTNADVADPGVSTVLADALGLTDQRPLRPRARMRSAGSGVLAAPMTLADFADAVAAALPATAGGIRVSGDPDGRWCARSR